MPIGLNRVERPADVVANAVHLARIATDEAEEEHVNSGKSAGGRNGGVVRAKSMTAYRRSEIARQGAAAHWENSEHKPTRTPDGIAPTGILLYDRLNLCGRI